MQYSYWSGQVRGTEEKLIENFSKEPTFTNAMQAIFFVLKIRSDFVYFRQKGMLNGELPPFDKRLLENVFTGAKNSIKSRIDIEIV
jgi:hypothetical protein